MPLVIPATSPTTLAQTIGSILAALLEAQAQSARTTIDFVNEIGFTRDASDQIDKLRSVQFKYLKLDENNERKEFIVELPLLGLVEIPVLSIKTARIEFQYDVTSTQTQSATTTGGMSPATSLLLAASKERTVLKGVIPPKGGNTAEKGALKVIIDVEKSALPVSLDRTLSILEVAATEAKKV